MGIERDFPHTLVLKNQRHFTGANIKPKGGQDVLTLRQLTPLKNS